MASERQIAANRLNAQKSTGPKSQVGQQRSSRNAYRHGLAVPISNVESEAELKDLSRQLAEDSSNPEILALTERAAGAQLDLARVRKTRAKIIEHAATLDAAGAKSDLELEKLRHRIAQKNGSEKLQGNPLQPELLGSTPLFNKQEEKWRLLNSVGPVLSELSKTYRYEKRAISRRNRAIREIVSIKPRTSSIV
jgi:hypothetical protein